MILFLRNLIVRDFWLKLFSLVLAVLIWLTVSFAIRKEGPVAALASANSERLSMQIPVLVMSTAADVRSFKVEPSEVVVTVRGEPKLLDALQPKDIHAIVDLTDIASARDLHERIQVSTPMGITVVSVEPIEVRVIVPPNR